MIETVDTIEAGMEFEDDILGRLYDENQKNSFEQKKLEWQELKLVKAQFLVLKEEPAFKLFEEHCLKPFLKSPYKKRQQDTDPVKALITKGVEAEKQQVIFGIMREFKRICEAVEPKEEK